MGDDAVTTLALSGADNTGKTKQLGILARRIGPAAVATGPLDAHDARWEEIKKDMTAWWFQTGPMQEVADVLAASYLQRSNRPGAGAGLRLMDRGLPMLEASVAATAAVREDLTPEQAADRARGLLERYAQDLKAAEAGEHGIVLLHHEDPAIGTARALSHETSVTPTYADYQRHLHHQIHRLVDEDRFDGVLVVDNRSVVAVQHDLRVLLHPHTALVPAGCLPGVRVVALGGMSESGKSTAGEYLRTRHGHARLKIGYLIDEAAHRAGIDDPYALAPVVRAELLLDGLDRYATAHHFLDRITLESLHELDVTAELRRMLGDQLSVAYIHTAAELRARRGTAGPADVTLRDTVKTSRGADEIASIADTVVDNNSTRLALERQLDGIALDAAWPAITPATTPVNALGLPVALERFLTTLLQRTTHRPEPLIDLLAVTGSGACGKYQHGWSDLDIFVIAEPDRTTELRQALTETQSDLGEVKLGLTVLSQAECRAGAVTSRLLHVMTLLGTGSLLPLWARPGLTIPAPPLADDVAASLEAGVQAAVEIRRQLLKGSPDLRVLFKVSALLAKVVLRFEGTEQATDTDALDTLVRAGDEPDDGLVLRARTERAAAQDLAQLVLDHWMATMPATAAAA
ncbi:nucleotidyltransferase domain-containing protein [Streptomyces lydicus]|uniref:nucleotidyltransferase domain-containing protein n=1 Tax=Streptomyces lydicus TaxID=47763 RepID=UPI001F50BF71|nr:nucleotidyltransferase domain-containing protein [Streptomyces lydicus]MCZ1006788.1 nucleotidyltransferase domain-containing protein [Streptomyces lydicus]